MFLPEMLFVTSHMSCTLQTEHILLHLQTLTDKVHAYQDASHYYLSYSQLYVDIFIVVHYIYLEIKGFFQLTTISQCTRIQVVNPGSIQDSIIMFEITLKTMDLHNTIPYCTECTLNPY